MKLNEVPGGRRCWMDARAAAGWMREPTLQMFVFATMCFTPQPFAAQTWATYSLPLNSPLVFRGSWLPGLAGRETRAPTAGAPALACGGGDSASASLAARPPASSGACTPRAGFAGRARPTPRSAAAGAAGGSSSSYSSRS
eukprot:COSAG06_NODE_32487_length_505_cov_1.054187_1_plen_140_part_01